MDLSGGSNRTERLTTTPLPTPSRKKSNYMNERKIAKIYVYPVTGYNEVKVPKIDEWRCRIVPTVTSGKRQGVSSD